MPVSFCGRPVLTGSGHPPAPLLAKAARLREDALAAWKAGLCAVQPQAAVARALAQRLADGGGSRLCEGAASFSGGPPALVVAVGKAAAGMLRGAADALALPRGRCFVLLPEDVDVGVVAQGVVVLRGGHPFPTVRSAASTRRILVEASALGAGQRLLVLLSGGTSALLEAPADGLTFEDLVAGHRVLVGSGLPIASINLVRGCLSAVKAGGLALLAWPASVTTLAISDVQGDDPAVLGSGPTVIPGETKGTRCRRAIEVLDAAGVSLPATARAYLEQQASSSDAPPAGCSVTGDYEVVASILMAIHAARAELAVRGYAVADDTGYLAGDTTAAAQFVAAAVAAGRGRRAAVFGGETTVVLPSQGTGRGGRNLDLASRLALALAGRGDVVVAVAGTDGVDGSSRAAGALVDSGSAARAQTRGLPLDAALACFDTEPALAAAGDLLETGPTGTNVGDLVVAVAA